MLKLQSEILFINGDGFIISLAEDKVLRRRFLSIRSPWRRVGGILARMERNRRCDRLYFLSLALTEMEMLPGNGPLYYSMLS